jgi:co-chaperonin GroES (HSP10)
MTYELTEFDRAVAQLQEEEAVLAVSKLPPELRKQGWRGLKGPMPSNGSGFHATGHRLLLVSTEVETVSAGGIVLAQKTVDKERSANVFATIVEVGYDAWSDKTTDYAGVGDKVLVGQYAGKFHVSPLDGKEYRFLSDLDVITPVSESL